MSISLKLLSKKKKALNQTISIVFTNYDGMDRFNPPTPLPYKNLALSKLRVKNPPSKLRLSLLEKI